MSPIIIIVGLLALPIAILLDSQKRLGRASWGWAVGMFLLACGGLGQVTNWNLFEPDTPVAGALGQVTAVWVCLFAIYRLWTQKKTLFQKLDKEAHAILEDDRIVQFYNNTLSTYLSGKLSALGKGFEELGRLPYERFVRIFSPNQGTALHVFFAQFAPTEDDEFLVARHVDKKAHDGWFVLTNRRLIQKDGKSRTFKEVILKDVMHHEIKSGFWWATLRFEMKTGEDISFARVQIYPLPEMIREVMSWQKELGR